MMPRAASVYIANAVSNDFIVLVSDWDRASLDRGSGNLLRGCRLTQIQSRHPKSELEILCFSNTIIFCYRVSW